MAKQIQTNPIIKFSGKMDTRSNNEGMNLDPNSTGIELYNLENGDLFFTDALTVRQGVKDISGGIITASGSSSVVYNLYSGSAATTYIKEPVYVQNTFFDREGMIINFTAPTGTLYPFQFLQGNVYLQDCCLNPATSPELGYDMQFQVYLHSIQTNLTSGISATNFHDGGGFHNIGLSGNFNGTYNTPQLAGASNQVIYIDPVPVAISSGTIINFGTNYISGNGVSNGTQTLPYGTPFIKVPFNFYAPYPIQTNETYYLALILNNTSGTTARGVQASIMCDGVDQVPNLMYANEYLSLGSSGTFSNVLRTQEDVSIPAGQKAWLQSDIQKYNSPSYILYDAPGVGYTTSAPIGNTLPPSSFPGVPTSNVNWQTAPNSAPFPGLTSVPSVDITGTQFGNIFPIASGVYNVQGAYFYANTWTGNGFTFFNSNQQPLDPTNYGVNYVASLYQYNGSNYSSSALLAQYSGNYTFNNPNTYQQNLVPPVGQDIAQNGPNASLEKIYALFPNPVVVNSTGGNYILTFQFTNQATNLPITDYAAKTIGTGTGWQYEFATPISIGMGNKQFISDTSIFTYLNTSTYQWSNYTYQTTDILAAGLISVPFDNAITSVYNYRVSDNRSQVVIFTQGTDLSFFELATPTVQTVLYTGGKSDSTFKWNHSTFQNLLISNQYSQSSGVVWDQLYMSGTSSMQNLGLQPVFTGNFGAFPYSSGIGFLTGTGFVSDAWFPPGTLFPVGVDVAGFSTPSGLITSSGDFYPTGTHFLSGVTFSQGALFPPPFVFPTGFVFPSGYYTYPYSTLPGNGIGIPTGATFDVILGTSILSGGIRASDVLSVTMPSSGTNNLYQIEGTYSPFNNATYPYDIYHVSGLAASGITSQGMSQYKMDIFSNGTYVFATQNSGSTYFLAPLCDSSGNAFPNPLPNNNTWNAYAPFYTGTTAPGATPGSGVYIYDIGFTGINAQQVPNIITYGQTYLLNQIPAPLMKKTIVFNNILFGIGDPNFPSRIWFSQIQSPEIWGGAGDINYGYYDVDADNGQEITGVEIYKGYMIIFKENSTYAAQYTSNAGSPLSIQNIDKNKGNLGIFNTVSTSYGVFGLSQFGPVLATYYGVETVADEILPYFQNLDTTDLIFSVAIHDVARQQIYWSVSSSFENPDNQIGLVYSYALKAWGVRRNGMWNCAGIIGDVNNFNLLYIGDTLGQISQIDSGTYTDDILFVDVNGVRLSKSVTLTFETPWMNFGGNSQMLKQAKTLRVNCEQSQQQLQIDVYYDQNETAPVYTRYLDMSQPVWNRVVSLAGVFRTVKFVVTSFGANADEIKINSMQLSYMNRGQNTNLW